jgi:hypothetical protein
MEISDSIRADLMRQKTWGQIATGLEIKNAVRKKSGTIVLCCIFHNEKTPSLWLRPGGRYICYGCGAHGDMIDFVLQLKNISDIRMLTFFFATLPTPPGPDQLALF